MNHEQAVQAIHSRGTVPDGYFGDRASVGFAFDVKSGKTLVVAKTGFYNSGLPDAIDVAESIWLLKNHPITNSYTINADKYQAVVIHGSGKVLFAQYDKLTDKKTAEQDAQKLGKLFPLACKVGVKKQKPNDN